MCHKVLNFIATFENTFKKILGKIKCVKSHGLLLVSLLAALEDFSQRTTFKLCGAEHLAVSLRPNL